MWLVWFPSFKAKDQENTASYIFICHTSLVTQGWVSPTFVSKAESIAANAVAEFSNIQLKLNGFLRNKIEKRDGRKLMALALRELIVLLYVCVESFHTQKKKKKKAGQKKNEYYFREAKRFNNL